MTWKVTAIVTGATALVGWLASPLPQAPAPSVVAPQSRAVQTAPNSDIEHQAARLRARLWEEAAFREPSRDLFRFAERVVQAPSRDRNPQLDLPPDRPSEPQAPLPTLVGIATDVVDGVTTRTAILSASDGVVLVREGESVGGLYRMGTIEEEVADLVRVADGQLLRLRLANPRP